MKVTITFEDNLDYDYKPSQSSFTKDLGEGDYETLLYAFGRAAVGAGYDWSSLTATVTYRDVDGDLKHRETVAHF